MKLPDNEDDPDKDKEWYGGKWLIHGPIDINYRSSKSENEIITVNGQKIDVLNLEFNKKLIDNRKNIKDDSRIGLQEGLDKDKFNSTNSVAKNEYVIEIKQFAVGTNNTGEPIKRYKVIYKIVEKPTNQIFKYYGWDPDKNPHQKELITKYILDSKGEIKNDKDGNPIKNPKYNPLLDPTTGTKKQIIWINNSSLSKKIKEKLSFVYPCLPNGNKILDYGIIAEASVLGMGALRNISIDKDIQQASGAKYWKCKIGDFRINNDQTKTLEWTKENDIQLTEIPLTNGTSEFSYMSEEGLWIVFTDIDSSISNVQLVLIDKNNKPENFFTDEIRHAKDNHGIELINKFNKFWNSTNAISEAFYNYLYWEDNISKEEAQKLSYESLLEKYQRFVTWSQRYDLPDIIPAEIQNIDLFSDSFMKWNKLNNLNGNTNTERIEKTIIDYIEFNLKQSAKLSEYFPYQNEWWKVSSNNWFIEEWADQNSKANWLKQAAEVYIFNTKEQKEYKGINFTLRGNGKIANQKRNFNIRNEAWHKYDKEIDLSKLDIKDSFEFKLDKKEFELPNKTIDEVDADYRKAIEQKIKELIIEELNNYYVKHNIEMWLDKDVELRNIEGIVSQLIRGKALNKAVEAEIKGINANLLNVKKISFKNLGDGGKFNLKNLSHVFLEDKLILKETQPNQIIQKVQNFIEEKAKQLNLKYEQDYQIYCIDIVAYWYELVQAYDDPRINKNPEFKKQLLKSLKFINDYKTIVIDNNIINIEFEPTDKILKNKLIKYYEKIKNEIKDDIFNRNLNLNLFEKWVVIMPTKNTEGFAQLKVFNKVEKDYDPSIDDPWVKPIEKKNNPDDKQNRLKSISKKWWFPLVMVISIIGLLIGAIFLTKTLLRKYGWSFGKRARHNKNKKCEKAIVKRKQFLKKEHNKNQKELEKKKNILKN
ncbi:Mbov_0399 family ICE element protein [Mycoplasmopsis adleri]|uniref:Mbov_0399 family ICE element protein n=1 Tax=Mycoplasmopsis adleri TaxID=51362 RepID=UPI003873A011